MKVTLDFSHNVVVEPKMDGDKVVGVVLTPKFTDKNGVVVAAQCAATTDKHRVIEKFALNVSGKTGKTAKVEQKEAIVPAAIDAGEPTSPPPPPPPASPPTSRNPRSGATQ